MERTDRTRTTAEGARILLGALATGAALRAKRPTLRFLLGAGGAYLLYRGLGTSDPRDPATRVGGTVWAVNQLVIQRSPGEVYDFIADLRQLPLFSRRVDMARKSAPDTWHISTRTPWGGRLDFDLEQTVANRPDQLSWCTPQDALHGAALDVRLTERLGGTEVSVVVWFTPPVSPLFTPLLRRAEGSRPLRRAGLTPSQHLRHDLQRLRQLLEAGEVATTRGQSSGRAASSRGARMHSRERGRPELQGAGGPA